mmetsp:Transcript_33955/g.58019  ORF Transcript_33955/g.58019 Transcript_33955/m.58019 type:complete len:695 (+) Transcript_33955:27-2111(+)
MDFVVSEQERPKRRAAKNALYRACPTCDRKFLLTEIEFHVNLCIEKMEKQAAKLLKPEKVQVKVKASSSFKADHSYSAIPPAPEFRPTVEEFADPLAYIESIRHKAQKYGICKIIPPEGLNWLEKSFEETVKEEDFFFQTKKQDIRHLARRGVADSFVCKLSEFLEENGKSLLPMSKIEGKRIDLYNLYLEVCKLGGYQAVTSKSLWPKVCSIFGVSSATRSVKQMKKIYGNNLYDFEISPTKFEIPKQKKGKLKQDYGMKAAVGPGATSTKIQDGSETEEDDNLCNIEDKNEEETDSDDETFGFASGTVHSLRGFKRQANKFARNWFNAKPNIPIDQQITPEQTETEFWNIVEEKDCNCKVQYGSDLDVKSHGSGFPIESTHPWNLNILPTLPKSLLRYLPEHVSGITIPMMYVGMMFSCFCWHVEDDYLYSINYLHTGAPKTWYGVSSYFSTHFEAAMKRSLPDLFEVQPDLLHHLTTMISPLELLANGVPVVRVKQYPGEFMITFPQAYHGGINNGFNVAEAVNFATPDWIPFGRLCVTDYQLVKRTHIFSNIELIVNALQLETNPDSIKWLFDAFWNARNEELIGRGNILKMGCKKIQQWPIHGPLPHSRACKVCNSECYLSCIFCPCSPNTYACLDHCKELCNCPIGNKILLTRYTTELMNALATAAEQMLAKNSGSKKRYLSPTKNIL